MPAPVDSAMRAKLARFFGEVEAAQLLDEILSELSLDEAVTPKARLAVGQALVHRGGLCAAAGHAIRAQAMLHGAPVR